MIDIADQVEQLREAIGDDDKVLLTGGPWSNELLAGHSRGFTGAGNAWPPSSKPTGVWYGCGIGWIDFVIETWSGGLYHVYELELDMRRMLVVGTMHELRELTERYGVRSSDPLFAREGKTHAIDWEAIAADGFQGIEICPYQWEARWPIRWYYPWDVASGCVWDPSAIRDVQELELPS